MEKLKDKKTLIAICAVVAVIIVAIILVAVFKKPSYKKQITGFVNGMNDSEQMEKFVDKYVDFRAIYAMEKVSDDKDVDQDNEEELTKAYKKAYKEAKKDDYEAEDFQKEVKELYSLMASYKDMMGEDASIELKEVGKAEDYKDMTAFKQVPFTITLKTGDNSEDMKFMGLFYKNKFVLANPVEEEEDEE